MKFKTPGSNSNTNSLKTQVAALSEKLSSVQSQLARVNSNTNSNSGARGHGTPGAGGAPVVDNLEESVAEAEDDNATIVQPGTAPAGTAADAVSSGTDDAASSGGADDAANADGAPRRRTHSRRL